MGSDQSTSSRTECASPPQPFEARFQQLLDHAPDAILVHQSGRIVYCNNTAVRLYRAASPEALKGKDAFGLVHPDERDAARKRAFHVQAGGDAHLKAFRHVRLDGQEVTVETTAAPIDWGGEPSVLVFIRDITGRLRAEEALRESERKYREMVEYTKACVYEVDFRTGKFSSVNDAMCLLCGYSREELLDLNAFDLLVEESRQTFQKRIQAWLGGREPVTAVEYRVRAKDGHEIHALLDVTFTRDEDGRPVGAMVIGHDITERKRVEAALRRSEEKYRSLVETTSDWVWEVDSAGVYTYASPKIKDLLGYEPEEVLGRTPFDFMPPAERERVARLFHGALRMGAPLNAVENINTHKSGRTVHLETSAVPIMDAGGHLLGYRGIDRDITKRKRAEAALAESERRFSVFMEHLPAGVFIREQTGRLLFVNRYFETFFGRGECMRKLPEVLLQQESAGRKIADDRKVLDEGPIVFQERITDARGGEHFFDTCRFPIEVEGSPALLGGIAVDITGRVNAEKELADTRILLQSAFHQTPVPMILVSAPEGIILHTNQAGLEMLGDEGEGYYAGRPLAAIEPAWQYVDAEGNRIPFDESPLALALRGMTTKNREMVVQRKDGTRRYRIVNAAPVYDDAGEMIAAIAVFPDITERKRIAEALEKRIVALTQPLDDAASIAYEDLFDLEALQSLQDRFAEAWGVATSITRPDGAPITRPSNFSCLCGDIIRKTAKGGRDCQLSDALVGRPNPAGPTVQACVNAGLWNAGASITVGGRHIANWLIGQVRDEAQSEAQIMAYAREIGADETAVLEAFRRLPAMPQTKFARIANALFALANQLSAAAYQNIQQARFITERTRAEAALRESEERFRRVVESSPLALAFADRKARVEYVNPKFTALFGYTLEDIPTVQDWFRLSFPDPAYRQSVVEQWWKALGTPAYETGTVQVVELRVTCKDGTVKVIEIFRSRMGSETLAVFNDLTERRGMEEERRRFDLQMGELQKLESLGVLAGGIAHDFNNLLMAILGNADLALLSLPPASSARRYVEGITEASHRAADLCRQMLAYSGKGRFVVERHDLSGIVREMGQMLGASVSKMAVMRYALAEGLPAVESDASQVRQVIMNLITNASEALGDRKGVITVSTGVRQCDPAYLSESHVDDHLPGGTYVTLDVSDTGCGMDAETQSRIFDPFFTTKFTGRGLGLAAVLGIVRGHKGAIRVTSEAGKGTTVRILFPALERDPGEAMKTERSVPPQGGGTILLVDDEPDVRDVAAEMLAHLGFRVLTANDGLEGLTVFRSGGDEIACVILDLTMPEMGGEETFGELRSLRSDVRVILSSGYNEQEVTQRFVGKGLAGFIQKPYTLANLRAALNRVLG